MLTDGDGARPPHGIILRPQRRILGRRAVRSERILEVCFVLAVVPKLVPVLVPIRPLRTRPDTSPPVTTTPTLDQRVVSGDRDAPSSPLSSSNLYRLIHCPRPRRRCGGNDGVSVVVGNVAGRKWKRHSLLPVLPLGALSGSDQSQEGDGTGGGRRRRQRRCRRRRGDLLTVR